MCRTLTLWDTKIKIDDEGKAFRFHKRYNKWKRIDNIKPNNKGYIQVVLTNTERKRKSFQLHRLVYKAHYPIWNIMDNSMNNCIDHKDGNKTNNHKDNLRVVTHQENCFNRTKAKGYCFNKKVNKWQAYIKVDGKRIHLGYFDTEEEARQAYLDAKPNYHIIKDRI